MAICNFNQNHQHAIKKSYKDKLRKIKIKCKSYEKQMLKRWINHWNRLTVEQWTFFLRRIYRAQKTRTQHRSQWTRILSDFVKVWDSTSTSDCFEAVNRLKNELYASNMSLISQKSAWKMKIDKNLLNDLHTFKWTHFATHRSWIRRKSHLKAML